MPYLIQRRVRTSQPTTFARVNWNSLDGKNVRLACSVVGGKLYAETRQGVVVYEVGTPVVNKHGAALKFNGSEYLDIAYADLPSNKTATLVMAGSIRTLDNQYFICLGGGRLGIGVQYGYLVGFHSGFSTLYGEVTPNDQTGVFVCGFNEDSSTGFITSDYLTLTEGAFGLAYSPDMFRIGARFDGTNLFTGEVNTTLLLDSADREQIMRVTQNPWSVFEDEEYYIWVPDVVGGYTATGAVSGSGSIVTGAATKTQVYSGSGAVTGTGATVAGTATRSFDSTGTVAGSGAIVTGSATNTQPSITSSGAVTGQGAIVSGAATRQFSSTGTVAGQGATVTGAATKTQVYSSTGAVVGGGAVVAGTATNTPLGISAYGDVAGQGSIVSGVATRAFLSTGAVVGAVATVTGSATRTFTATGAIAGYTAVITGAATNTPLGINGYGSVSGQGASVSGTATVTAVFTATGAVVGAGATITGYATNVRVVTSSGAISGQGATVAGAATVSGITVWPLASDVRRGVVYGPNGIDYTGTLSVGTGTGGGMNVTLSEPRLSVVSRDNSVYVIHETQRKIFS